MCYALERTIYTRRIGTFQPSNPWSSAFCVPPVRPYSVHTVHDDAGQVVTCLNYLPAQIHVMTVLQLMYVQVIEQFRLIKTMRFSVLFSGFLFFPLSLWCCFPTRAITSSFLRFLYHTRRRSTDDGQVISSSQRPLPNKI